jgi:neutral ceramidase
VVALRRHALALRRHALALRRHALALRRHALALRRHALALLAATATALATLPLTAAASTPSLLVGVGQADITPDTGGFKGGWACSCAKALGQHTRLYARVVVIQQGEQKVALVAEDLAMVGAGMIRDAAALLPGRGFSEQNVIDSATHTHGSQSGYMNFPAYNSVLPRNPNLTEFALIDTAADQALYSFMTRRLALAIQRADDDRQPGAIGWGESTLLGVTQNRSLEAHLAGHGIHEPPGTGSVDQDPRGYPGTIDPAVNVLRADQYRDGGLQPAGVFATFADHGTVAKEDFPYFTADHQGAAERALAQSTGARVIAFANSDAGDMTSGIQYSGPAGAEEVGRREADAMYAAWQSAGQAMTTGPTMNVRWTRICMCGQDRTDTTAVIGQAAAAGSEEGRTVFSDAGLAHEGDRLPFDIPPQGDKVQTLREDGGSVPTAVPLTALQLGDRLLVTYPGEPTVGVGNALRTAIRQATGQTHVVLVGYAGEYLDYWTTPAEFEAQHYEGGFTVYGQYASVPLNNAITDLARRLTTGQNAPAPYPYDPGNGVHVSDAALPDGATTAAATGQPAGTTRLGHPAFTWTGGPDGTDRPVDAAFVTVQHDTPAGWRQVADDLGLQLLWDADGNGAYRARWEVPLTATPGSYRFTVSGEHYRLTSAPFTVTAGAILTPEVRGTAVGLRYPRAVVNDDWTYRPPAADRGTVAFQVDGRTVLVRSTTGDFPIPDGAHVVIPAGGAHDRYGNTNPHPIQIR